MKIVDVKLGMLRVPLVTPFKTALRTVEAVEDVVVMLETDTGHIGYGNAPATAVITGDTHGSVIEAVRTVFTPLLLEQNVADLNRLTRRIQGAMINNTSAKAAVEIALYDLFAQSYKTPLYRLLGGGDNSLTTDITISVDYIDKMVADAESAVERGFEILKLKVGKDIGLDIERIKAVFAAVKGRALLRLDANQGWSPKQAVLAIRGLEEAGVLLELVEQPVKANNLEGMRYIAERVRTPIMADESVFGPREVMHVIDRRAADIINIKLMKTGGISNALKIADIADLHDLECMVGCMLETSIGVSAAAHMAAAKAPVVSKLDLDVPSLCKFDPVVGGAAYKDADIILNETPGLGIEKIEGLQLLA
ncbi:dipeptide epimerase [Microbulbifer hydrolyticus]|uniref:Dipeptide epimerase n=1 Tax=Microbulbifer hydrolyticus TaxID=48074 RepID=A0A6P1TAW4_9GAMM|nr:dipeptide epimerase [Microbulbifer hydrolyticus]MBB5210764.1 o-succinylbenzoate synthase [Microbulbifer hydrolyticus]QHQ38793.1 dipeptide epimerase [Microbulbifer hydrolyticus]